ncbi:SEL1-like repeat protein [Methylobacter sp.]|uniref:SEL1-like repeat protein n=1 Tax=Methylobacter sp. TaxID=2051955 RepID=UPI0025D22E75|nr:SEL1-like repeat protein [Methylobacter sp.]
MGQFNLGQMYFNGTGVPQDYAQAYMWTELAAAQGLEKAVEARDSLVKVLTPSQTEEGKKLVREWIATHPQITQ